MFLQKTLSNGDDDRIGFFDFFTIEKREPLQHVFLCVAPQSTINRISTSTPRSTQHYHFIQTPLLCHTAFMPHRFYANTAFMPTLHINAAHISILQAYHFIAICYQSDHSIPFLYKISFYATSFPRRFHATPTTLKRCTPATILPVSSPLDLRFNSTELFKIIARAIMLPQHIAFFLSHRA